MKLFFAVVATLILSSCASLTKDLLKDPEVSVVDFKVTDVSLQDISIDIKMNIKNPNGIALNVDEVTYALKFSGKDVTEGTFKQGVKVPANGQNEVTVPLKFKYSSINSLVSSLFNNTFTKEYELNGSAKIGIFNIPFTEKGEVKFNKK